MKPKKIIAWGVSPIFEIFIANNRNHNINYCVDSSPAKQGSVIGGVSVRSPEELFRENPAEVMVLNFGHSSGAIQSINTALSEKGFTLGENFVDFAAYVRDGFVSKVKGALGKELNAAFFACARAFNFNSNTPLETTVLGNWLLLELVNATRGIGGSIAEIGAYKGGNAYFLVSSMSLLGDKRNYFILDSFKGFDKMSDKDPKALQNVYDYDYGFNHIANKFSVFEQAKLIRGFVPKTFSEIPEGELFSLVFFDCDLYKPALDTFEFFWGRLKKGGYLVIHDNVATESGWTGVAKATEEFFGPKGVHVHDFWETTMSVVVKS